jgi:hypothetical protein
VYDVEDVLRELEEEIADEDKLEMAEVKKAKLTI